MKIIYNFVIKEFLQFKRDRRMFMTVIIAPVIQLIFLGYAANMDIKVIHTVVFDQDRTETSRNFIRSFESSGYFNIDYYVDNYSDLTKLIDKGDALVGIVIPTDFEKKIGAHRTVQVQTIYDGSDGNKAAISAGYSMGIAASFSQDIANEYLQTAGIKKSLSGTIEPEVRVWYNPDLTTRVYMLPSIVGLIIMLVTTSLTSLAIVKEREIGTMEQLIVTPIKSYQIIAGKLVPFTILGFLSASIVISVMRFWFDIPIKGSVVFLFFSAFLFMLSTLGLGLFISTIAKTQVQAMITSAFAVIMPMIFLSGFAFPIENMPILIQYVTYLVPLRYFIVILRGIILKGIGLNELWPQVTALLIFGTSILLLSSLRFRKKLE
ncbi:MAG: ABC transporter permease [Ignavibacteria bacterium]|jgi:ABC-2 type transport system permease protein